MSKLFSLCTLHDSAIYRAKLDCKVTAKQTNKQRTHTMASRWSSAILAIVWLHAFVSFSKRSWREIYSFFTLSTFNIKASFSPTSFALRHLYLVKPSIRWGKRSFKWLWPFGTKWFWVFQKLLLCSGFFTLEFTDSSQKTREFAVSSGSVGENVLLIPDMREEWPDYFKPIGRALLGQGGTEDSHHRSAETVLLSC